MLIKILFMVCCIIETAEYSLFQDFFMNLHLFLALKVDRKHTLNSVFLSVLEVRFAVYWLYKLEMN